MKLVLRVEVSGMIVEVRKITDDGRPLEALIHFSAPLEASCYKWVQWNWRQGAYTDFTPPHIGHSIWVPRPPLDMPNVLELMR